MSARTWRVWLAAGVAAILLRLLLPTELQQGLAYVVIGAAAVVAIVVGVRRQRPLRALRWYLLAAGQGLFVAGDLAYTLLEESRRRRRSRRWPTACTWPATRCWRSARSR